MGKGEARFSQGFLSAWLIAPEQFERWVDVLAGNDDDPEEYGLLPEWDDIPAVSWLSFY